MMCHFNTESLSRSDDTDKETRSKRRIYYATRLLCSPVYCTWHTCTAHNDMHDALKGPARENCLSESQMPRANFSQLTKWLPRECHCNFMLYGFGIRFFIHSLGANAERRWRVELGSFHICPGLFLPTPFSPRWAAFTLVVLFCAQAYLHMYICTQYTGWWYALGLQRGGKFPINFRKLSIERKLSKFENFPNWKL